MTVSRDDLERKAQQLIGAVEDTTQSAKNTTIAAVVAVGLVVATAFIVGRRRGSRNKTVVEVYRV
ncbi:MAG TPA: hypothetical protein VFP42_11200 [Acidimicrobiia bacterium]|nr:hypothetical protein [Acidimicrobiia bacterium]